MLLKKGSKHTYFTLNFNISESNTSEIYGIYNIDIRIYMILIKLTINMQKNCVGKEQNADEDLHVLDGLRIRWVRKMK